MSIRPLILSLLVPVFLSNLAMAASESCIYNEKECTCRQKPPGGLCIHYKSGDPGSELCTSFLCGHGHECNCTFMSSFFIMSLSICFSENENP